MLSYCPARGECKVFSFQFLVFVIPRRTALVAITLVCRIGGI